MRLPLGARLAAAPAVGCFPFVFRPTRWNAPTSFLLARQTAPPQNAQRSSDGGRGLCCAPCGRARRGDAFPFGFRFKRRNVSTPLLLAPQTAPPQSAQRSSDGGRGLCCAPCGRARRGGAPPLASASSAGMCQRRFACPIYGITAIRLAF